MPGQTDAEDLPPAVILDVDDTVVSNIDFQLSFERPFTNRKLYDFYRSTQPFPCPVLWSSLQRARAAGVTVFFVTNRPVRSTSMTDPTPVRRKQRVIRRA